MVSLKQLTVNKSGKYNKDYIVMEFQLPFGFLTKDVKIETDKFIIYRKDVYDFSEITDKNGWITSFTNHKNKNRYSRIFDLPLNAILEGDFLSEDHAKFMIWCYSFLYGIRLSYLKNGFLDAVNINKSVFNFIVYDYADILKICYNYKMDYKPISAIIHMLFMAKVPEGHTLQYERFSYLYSAFDSCFRIIAQKQGYNPKKICAHSQRIEKCFEMTNIEQPLFLTKKDSNNNLTILNLRNKLIHESIFNGEPVGYSATAEHEHYIYEFSNYCCKLLLYILDILSNEYKAVPCSSRNSFPNYSNDIISS